MESENKEQSGITDEPKLLKPNENDYDSTIQSRSQDVKNFEFLDESQDETNTSVKIEFDAYIDANNRVYKKYNLRKELKLQTKDLNELKLSGEPVDRNKSNEKLAKTSIIEFKCDLCSKIFAHKISLTYHRRTHGEKNIYTCLHCQVVFATNKDLLMHKTTHSYDQCFVCKKCKQAFSDELLYTIHSYNHEDSPYKCRECLFTSTDIKSLKSHVIIHFDQIEKCDICHEMVIKRIWKEHLKKHNTKIECGECGKILNNKYYYDYHMTTHTGVKTKQCLYCGKGFANSSQLNVHTRIHTNERLFECKVCFMRFKQSSDLKRHLNSHNEKRFECDKCGKKFLHKESIKAHLRLHNNYKPYKCPQCDECFTTSSHLTIHTNRLHITKKNICEICNITVLKLTRHYKSKSHLNKMYGQSNLNRNK